MSSRTHPTEGLVRGGSHNMLGEIVLVILVLVGGLIWIIKQRLRDKEGIK